MAAQPGHVAPLPPQADCLPCEMIHPIPSNFSRIGLKKTSVLKAEKIAIVHESVFQKRIGSFPTNMMVQVEEALKKALRIS